MLNLKNVIENLVLVLISVIAGVFIGYYVAKNVAEDMVELQQEVIREAIRKETTSIKNEFNNEFEKIKSNKGEPIQIIIDPKSTSRITQNDSVTTVTPEKKKGIFKRLKGKKNKQ